MISYPRDWRQVGVEITAQNIEERLVDVLTHIGCKNLAFSGGLDSSLLLYYMCQIFDRIKIFTIGLSKAHPDVAFAESVVEHYGKKFDVRLWHYVYCPTDDELKRTVPEEFPGDHAVELFYRFVAKHTNEIIAGDGIDEFMCGYYAHVENPNEESYYNHLRRLYLEQLVPLDLNSGNVEIYLPYIDEKMIALMSQIPLKDKVDKKERKKFLVEMAKGKVPKEILLRRKYGFCDALLEKNSI